MSNPRLDFRMMFLPIACLVLLIYIEKVKEGHTYQEALKSCAYDIDQARALYMEDMKMSYMRGCDTGTEYPIEYKMPSNSFNQNSVPIWCGKEFEYFEDYIERNAANLGRRR